MERSLQAYLDRHWGGGASASDPDTHRDVREQLVRRIMDEAVDIADEGVKEEAELVQQLYLLCDNPPSYRIFTRLKQILG